MNIIYELMVYSCSLQYISYTNKQCVHGAVQTDDLYIHNLQYILVSYTNKINMGASNGVNDRVLMLWHFQKYFSYVAITRPD